MVMVILRDVKVPLTESARIASSEALVRARSMGTDFGKAICNDDLCLTVPGTLEAIEWHRGFSSWSQRAARYPRPHCEPETRSIHEASIAEQDGCMCIVAASTARRPEGWLYEDAAGIGCMAGLNFRRIRAGLSHAQGPQAYGDPFGATSTSCAEAREAKPFETERYSEERRCGTMRQSTTKTRGSAVKTELQRVSCQKVRAAFCRSSSETFFQYAQ